MRRIIFISALFITCLVAKIDNDEAQRHFIIGAVDYPPYDIKNFSNEKRGFDAETALEAFKRCDINASVYFYPWSRVMQEVKAGKIAGALTIAKNEEREKSMYFSVPISQMTDVVVVKKSRFKQPINNLKNGDPALKNLLAGVSRGSYTEDALKKDGLPVDVSIDGEIILRKLVAGRVDYMPTVLEYVSYVASKMDVSDTIEWFVREDVVTRDFHLVLGKDYPGAKETMTCFDDKFKEMVEDGTYQRIHDKYR